MHMTINRFCFVAISLLGAGCSESRKTPGCGDDATLGLVDQIVQQEIQSLMIEGFAINYVRGIGYDETVDAHSCAASVRFNGGNDTGEYATDITFDVHTDATDPSSFVVQVYGWM